MIAFSTALNSLLLDSNFGIAASYTPVGGVAREIIVILYQDAPQGMPFSEMAEVRDLVDIRKSDLAAVPQTGDTILIGTSTYRVDRWPLPDGRGDDGLMYTVRVRKT